MRKIAFLSIAAIAALGMTSCSKQLGLTADMVTVTPTPLEQVGNNVPATLTANLPEKFLKKKSSMVVTPVLKYEGGEALSEPSTFQGEKVEGNGTTVQYKAGGVYTMRANFAYVPEMIQSDLYLRFDITYGTKKINVDDVKVGYGVVSTNDLYKKALATTNPALSADAYQRIVKQQQEAQIKYLINQANVRASELKTTSVQDFANILKEINNNQEKLKLNNVEISAYASPEGAYDFNEKLAENRQNTSADYVKGQLKANSLTTDVNTKYTAEDWEGFQQLVAASNIQDKDVILRVLSMYQDPAERETQIRNMSVVFNELAESVLPELRRARMIANYDVIGRSDEQIVAQFKSDASQLSIEELLYGANLQTNNADKKAWYEKAAQLYPQDVRAFNNLANIAYQNGDLATAAAYLAKAKTINANAPEVATNLALVALANGSTDAAEALIAKGTGSSAYSEVLGNINLAKGNYAAAASNLAGVKTNSAALAQILNKDYAAAASTLAGIQNPDATTAYLSAVLGARQGNANAVVSGLTKAIQQDSTYAQRAAKDLEFANFAAEIAGLVK